MSSVGTKIRRGLQDPSAAWEAVRGRLRGKIFTVWCACFHPRIRVGRNLYLSGRIKARGPGTVIIGDHVNIGMLVTPYTHSRDAVIRIGDDVFLNGTRISCIESVEVGARCILADCRINDHDFHSVDPDHRNDPAFIRHKPVTIEENVWVTMSCIIQKGVRIGRDSTITAGSVVRSDIPARSVAGGNPAVVLKTLPPAATPRED